MLNSLSQSILEMIAQMTANHVKLGKQLFRAIRTEDGTPADAQSVLEDRP